MAESARAGAGSDGLKVPPVVTKTLNDVAAKQGFKKPTFQIESGSGFGDGFTSVLFRVVIQDEDASGQTGELHLMCKSLLTDFGPGNMMSIAFEAEGLMYNEMLPALRKTAELKDPLPWPRCYSADVDGPDPPCIALADLRPEGFVMAKKSVPLDFEHCRLALQQIARYHGAGMAFKHQRPDEFTALTSNLGKTFKDPKMMENFKQFFDIIENAPDLLSDRFPVGSESYKRLKAVCSNPQKHFTDMVVKPPDDTPGEALIHGDFHLNNMMFQYKDGEVVDCRLIDFQMCRYGRTIWDVATLLMPCTDKAMRDVHLDDLLRVYHRELQATLRAAGCENPDDLYSWEHLMAAAKENMTYGMFFAPVLLLLMVGQTEEIVKLQEAINEMSQSMAETSERKPPPTMTMPSLTPSAKQRFGDIVQTLLDRGWL